MWEVLALFSLIYLPEYCTLYRTIWFSLGGVCNLVYKLCLYSLPLGTEKRGPESPLWKHAGTWRPLDEKNRGTSQNVYKWIKCPSQAPVSAQTLFLTTESHSHKSDPFRTACTLWDSVPLRLEDFIRMFNHRERYYRVTADRENWNWGERRICIGYESPFQ